MNDNGFVGNGLTIGLKALSLKLSISGKTKNMSMIRRGLLAGFTMTRLFFFF